MGEGCENESLLVLNWKRETPSVILVWSVIITLVAKSRAVIRANTCTAKGHLSHGAVNSVLLEGALSLKTDFKAFRALYLSRVFQLIPCGCPSPDTVLQTAQGMSPMNCFWR